MKTLISPVKLSILTLGLVCGNIRSDVNIFFISESQGMKSQFITETGEIVNSKDIIIDLVRLPASSARSDGDVGEKFVSIPSRSMIDEEGRIRSSFYIADTTEQKGELGVRVRALVNGEPHSGIYALAGDVDLSEGLYDIPPNNVMLLSGLDLIARKGTITDGGDLVLTNKRLENTGGTVISISQVANSPVLRVSGIEEEVLKFEIQYCDSLAEPDWKILDDSHFEIRERGEGGFDLTLKDIKRENLFVRVAYY